jgi:VIT1/CCC1 family predicted Fe2+/Mn2+ transporter
MGKSIFKNHNEQHLTDRVAWLRAAVLGANDGIISISSLLIGVASASSSSGNVLIAGVAGLVAGAMSMAAGEYVSVSSQEDLEKADLAREKRELEEMPERELEELANIYVQRGVERSLAVELSRQMMAKDALGTHAREELNISSLTAARPVTAAFASAAAFTLGGFVPLLPAFLVPEKYLAPVIGVLSILLLATLGTLAAKLGGAAPLKPALRLVFWGAVAMILSAAVGGLFGIQ